MFIYVFQTIVLKANWLKSWGCFVEEYMMCGTNIAGLGNYAVGILCTVLDAY